MGDRVEGLDLDGSLRCTDVYRAAHGRTLAILLTRAVSGNGTVVWGGTGDKGQGSISEEESNDMQKKVAGCR